MRRKAFRAAFPLTLPICVGFLFVGVSYGLLMNSMGFPFYYPTLISLFVCAGSMQFVAVNLLLASTPVYEVLLLTLMVNARHLFYGLSLLEKYKQVGRKKAYMIFALCDETFSINCGIEPPEEVDKGWFMFFVTLLNHSYWVIGSTLGAVLGYIIPFNTQGIEFVMTALFVVIFLGQWEERADHKPALIGVGASGLCLLLFGSSQFMLPAMLVIVMLFLMDKSFKSKEAGAEKC